MLQLLYHDLEPPASQNHPGQRRQIFVQRYEMLEKVNFEEREILQWCRMVILVTLERCIIYQPNKYSVVGPRFQSGKTGCCTVGGKKKAQVTAVAQRSDTNIFAG